MQRKACKISCQEQQLFLQKRVFDVTKCNIIKEVCSDVYACATRY